MTNHAHAPHFQGPQASAAPNAALLIDFDNVTMGMRSDLSKDLRKLLQSDVIRGKVTVQRAYADWRRYPQYIVPLSENSIDLIFAPAYGSSKKNATDIRMAIDAIELVFTRPEIGTYILLTGDSDFSSCVLKLKEYGKYVIGVGIQESSSDILVQNCDEYYSYTSLAGLQKTTETDMKSMDPWELVERAVKKMADKGDVMRSDRLKQVMLEMDSSFDEGTYGFSKFSRFVTEAASRKILELKKMPNGQYEVSPAGGGGRRKERDEDRGRSRSRRGRDNGRSRSDARHDEKEAEAEKPVESPAVEEPAATAPERQEAATEDRHEAESAPGQEEAAGPQDGVAVAYALLVRSLEDLRDDGRYPVRDSDVKRKMLEIEPDFDEGTLGFSKFSRFLRQAHDQEVVDLAKQDGGSYEVSLGKAASRMADAGAAGTKKEAPARKEEARDKREPRKREEKDREEKKEEEKKERKEEKKETGRGPVSQEMRPEDVIDEESPGRLLGRRGGTTRRRGDDDEPPPILEGQGRPAGAVEKKAPEESTSGKDAPSAGTPSGAVDLGTLDLPSDPKRIVRYLTSYKGVGQKTAEQLVEAFGGQLFQVLHTEPGKVKDVIPAGRADQLLAGWEEDLRRRVPSGGSGSGGESRNRRGRRGGRRSNRGGDRGGS